MCHQLPKHFSNIYLLSFWSPLITYIITSIYKFYVVKYLYHFPTSNQLNLSGFTIITNQLNWRDVLLFQIKSLNYNDGLERYLNFSVFEFVGQFSIVFEFELNSLIAVFEFVLDSLIILLSKLIHLDQFKWRSFCLPQEPKKKNTVHVDIRQKN